VSYAYDNGAFLAAAAGNDGEENVSYPAAYSECVAVSALDSDGDLASYSNYGTEIELCAPGSSVYSTTTDARGSYENLWGTSMATPVVSGVAALALDNWDVTNGEVRQHLKETAVDVGLSSTKEGWGRVDAANAVSAKPGEDTCGDNALSSNVVDSLSGDGDSDCWTWSWEYPEQCKVKVTLDRPSDADFDLFVNEGRAECPTTSDYDYYSMSLDSYESITITEPDTSTKLYVLVDSWDGSGDYGLIFTEYT